MGALERLDSLAARINEEHRACETAVNAALEHALRCGALLQEAKEQVPHGSFTAWVRDHFEGSERTAQAYMRLHRNRHQLDPQRAADLSVRGALRELSTPKPQPTLEELEARAEASLQKATAAEREVEAILEEMRAELGPEEYQFLAGYFKGRMQAAKDAALARIFGA